MGGEGGRMTGQVHEALKLPPQNLEAERAVLGAVLLDNQALNKALEIIGPSELYRPAHIRIFEAMIALFERNQVIDLVTLTDHLQHNGALEGIGGSAYLTDLAQSVVTATSVTHHAKIVKRLANERQASKICHELLRKIQDDRGGLDLAAHAASIALSKIDFGGNGGGHYKSGTCKESNPASAFRPIDVGTMLEDTEEEIAWIVDGYLAPGSCTLLAGPPKVGKTTLTYNAIVNVALGRPWLGRVVRASKVLVLALEEHKRDVVQRFWATENDALAGKIKIVSGSLPFNKDVLQEIVTYIQKENIGLVLVDTLHSWWGLDDENSAAEVLKAGGLLNNAIRQTPAAWLCNAHTRKSGGDYGSEIRGSSALLGLVDVALSLKRTDTAGTQRILEAVSRYADTPPKLVIGLGDHGYEALGSPEEVGLTAKIEKLRAALTETGQTVKELIAATGLSKQNVSKCLTRLGEPIVKEGTGHKSAPFTYRRHSISPTPNHKGGTCDESNPTHEILSVAPPIPCDELNSAIKEEVLIDAD